MKLYLLLLLCAALFACASDKPGITTAQERREDCVRYTGSNLPKCGPNAARDSGVVAVDGETVKTYLEKAGTRPIDAPQGERR